MLVPRQQCLFCSSAANSFRRDEHPIPESLGNDDLVLPPGFVCDGCNQYFGSKLEQLVLGFPPFNFVRMALNVRSKKGKVPHYRCQPAYCLFPTGYRDVMVVTGKRSILEAAMAGEAIPLPEHKAHDWFVCRFLMKMGLELMLLTENGDPYDKAFDEARQFVRAPKVTDTWEYCSGRYPRKSDLVNREFERDGENWVNEQLYQYSVGAMSSGEVGFAFLYRDHYFAVNLNSRKCTEYAQAFNSLNEFQVQVIGVRHPTAAKSC